jgi:hypothetical protein
MTLKRDPKYIQDNLVIKDGKVYCKEKCTIEFPKLYLKKELADLQEISYVYGIFAIIMGDKYSVSIIPSLCSLSPIMINEIEREDVEYLQFMFGKGDCIINDIKVVKQSLLAYNFFETFYIYAKVPWFMDYEDLVKVMDNLVPYAGSNVGGNWIANELTTSFITRSRSDKKKYYRQVGGDKEYVDLMNVRYSVNSNVLKLGGNFLSDSIVSAIVQPESQSTRLESLVR